LGVLFAPLLLTIREPQRRERAGPGMAIEGGWAAVRSLFAGKAKTLAIVYVTYSNVAFVGFAFTAWSPTHLIRGFGLAPSRAGFLVGVTTALAGIAGCAASGWLSDYWTRRAVAGQKFRVTVLGWALVLPAMILFPFAGTVGLCLAALSVALFGNAMLIASAPSVLNDIFPNEQRGMGVALYFICQATFGISLGPLALAVFNETVFHGHDIGRSFLYLLAPASAVGLVISLLGQKAYQQLRDRMAALTRS
jgi:MFS family permease